jgi:hypothetical protein
VEILSSCGNEDEISKKAKEAPVMEKKARGETQR